MGLDLSKLYEAVMNAKAAYVYVSIASTSCVLSVFGSLLIIVTYLCYPTIRKPARLLLLWLSVADLGTAVSYLATFIACGNSCDCELLEKETFTLLGIYFPVCSFLWTDSVGLYFYAAIYQKSWIAPRRRLFLCFHFISWCLPALICVTIIVVNAELSIQHFFGGEITGGWCWIQQWKYALLGGKVIEILSYIFLITVYVLSWIALRRRNQPKWTDSMTYSKSTALDPMPRASNVSNHDYPGSLMGSKSGSKSSSKLKSSPSNSIAKSKSKSLLRASRAEDMRRQTRQKALSRLLLIPIIFVCLRVWGTAHMFMDVVSDDHSFEGWQKFLEDLFHYMQAICDPLQGFCNGILFVVFVAEVRQQLFKSLKRRFGFRCLNICGMLCCCHYCCSCFCSGCNECFACCLKGEFAEDHDMSYLYGSANPRRSNHNEASPYRFLTTKPLKSKKAAEFDSQSRLSDTYPTVHSR